MHFHSACSPPCRCWEYTAQHSCECKSFYLCISMRFNVYVHVFESAQHKRIVYVYCLTAFHSQTRKLSHKKIYYAQKKRARERDEWSGTKRRPLLYFIHRVLHAAVWCRLFAHSFARFVCLFVIWVSEEEMLRAVAALYPYGRPLILFAPLIMPSIYLSFGLFCVPFCASLCFSLCLSLWRTKT